MDYILSKHLVNSSGKTEKIPALPGRSGRIVMTNEAYVLRELRLRAGLSMRKAGDLIGCSDSYVSHVENGRADTPKGEKLDKFLTIYGGMKQKSFYEKVRDYQKNTTSTELLINLIPKLNPEKIKMLLALAQLP